MKTSSSQSIHHFWHSLAWISLPPSEKKTFLFHNFFSVARKIKELICLLVASHEKQRIVPRNVFIFWLSSGVGYLLAASSHFRWTLTVRDMTIYLLRRFWSEIYFVNKDHLFLQGYTKKSWDKVFLLSFIFLAALYMTFFVSLQWI